MQNSAIKPQVSTLIWWILLLVIPLPGMGTDLVAPSLPHIATYFNVPSDLSKLAISVYMFAYGIGLGCFGISSDYTLRKPIVVVALCLYSVICFLAAHAGSINILLGLRALQGAMAAATVSIVRTILLEVTPDCKMPRLSAWISTVWGIGPIIAPGIGGYLEQYFGWHAGFYFFAIYGALFAIVYFFTLPETRIEKRLFNGAIIWSSCLNILKQKLFWGISLLMGLSYALLILFNVLAPFIIQNLFHKTAVFYGNTALGLGLVFFVTSLFAKKAIEKFSPSFLIKLCLAMGLILSVIILMIGSWLNDAQALTALLLLSVFLYGISSIMYPLCMFMCFKLSRALPGTYNALNLTISLMTASSVGFFASMTLTQHWQELVFFDIAVFLLMIFIFVSCIKNSMTE